MAIHHFPIGKLRRQLSQRLSFERRHAAAAGYAALIGQTTHPGSTQTSSSRTSTGYVFSGFNAPEFLDNRRDAHSLENKIGTAPPRQPGKFFQTWRLAE